MKRPKVPEFRAGGGWRAAGVGLFAALASVLSAGCGNTNAPLANGVADCRADSNCPASYHCALDNKCWMNGQDPSVDMYMSPDLLAPPAPPSQVWITSGGGSATDNGQQLNVTIGGTPVVGQTTSAGQVFTFGYFVTDTL